VITTFIGFKELCILFTVSPATEKNLEVEAAGMFSKHLATVESCGYLFSLSFHQVSGLVFLLTTFSAKYCSNSSVADRGTSSFSGPNSLFKAVIFAFFLTGSPSDSLITL